MKTRLQLVAFLLAAAALTLPLCSAFTVRTGDMDEGNWHILDDGTVTSDDITVTRTAASEGLLLYNSSTPVEFTYFAATFDLTVPTGGCVGFLFSGSGPDDVEVSNSQNDCGYGNQEDVFVVEFDRRQDADPEPEPDIDHVALHYANAGTPVESGNNTMGQYAIVDLDGSVNVNIELKAGELKVLVDAVPVLTQAVADLNTFIGAGPHYMAFAGSTNAGSVVGVSAINLSDEEEPIDPVTGDPTGGGGSASAGTATLTGSGSQTESGSQDPEGGGFGTVIVVLLVLALGGVAVFAALNIMKKGDEETPAGKAAKKRRSQDAERAAKDKEVKRRSKSNTPATQTKAAAGAASADKSGLLAQKRSSTGSKAKSASKVRISIGSKGNKRSSQASKGGRGRGNSASRGGGRSSSAGRSSSGNSGSRGSNGRSGSRGSSGDKHHHRSHSRSKKKKNPGKPKVPKKNYTPDDPTEAWLQAATQGAPVVKH